MPASHWRRDFGCCWALVACCLALGCSPSACSRQEARTLFPADSASRAFASTLPIDTLDHVGSVTGDATSELEYPRSILPAASGAFLVADSKSGSVHLLQPNPTGGDLRLLASGYDFPYAAGVRGDTVFVYASGSHELTAMSLSGSRSTRSLHGPRPEQGRLSYAAAAKNSVFVKVLGDRFDGYIGRIRRDGEIEETWNLRGPTWLHAGMLRVWGDTLLSLRGYRPVVDLVLPDGRLDSLRLHGFDSPMLARSRLFALGQLDRPPLLAASAAPSGNRLFVLNMRPGWLRVDVYDRSGNLTHVLTEPNPSFDQSFYPTDLAVVRTTDRSYTLAITVVRPAGRVDLYRWKDR